jgi:transposase
MPYSSSLSDAEWKIIEPLLPQKKKTRPPKWSSRQILDGIFYQLKNGCNWRSPAFLSGKKHCYTRKHLAGVARDKRVLILSHAREGKLHDKKLHDRTDLAGAIPDEIPILVDLGFQGMQKQ